VIALKALASHVIAMLGATGVLRVAGFLHTVNTSGIGTPLVVESANEPTSLATEVSLNERGLRPVYVARQ
jgi:hypothetical protein